MRSVFQGKKSYVYLFFQSSFQKPFLQQLRFFRATHLDFKFYIYFVWKLFRWNKFDKVLTELLPEIKLILTWNTKWWVFPLYSLQKVLNKGLMSLISINRLSFQFFIEAATYSILRDGIIHLYYTIHEKGKGLKEKPFSIFVSIAVAIQNMSIYSKISFRKISGPECCLWNYHSAKTRRIRAVEFVYRLLFCKNYVFFLPLSKLRAMLLL